MSEVFSRHYRKVKAIFGATDVLLTSLAFLAAYWTRTLLPFEKNFFLDLPVAALLLVLSGLCWVAIGYWFQVYEKLDSAHPRVVLRDAFRQCALGGVSLVLAEFLLRLDLSRSFVLLFATYAWVFLCLFRINAARVIGALRREFGTAHYVMVVGSGESALRLGRALERSADYGVRLVGFLDDRPGLVQLSQSYEQFALPNLPELLRRQVIDEVIFAVDSRKLGAMEELPAVRRAGHPNARGGGFLPSRQQPSLYGSSGRDSAADFLGRAARRDPFAGQESHGCASGRCRAGPAISGDAPHRAIDPVDLARPGDLPAGALRAERPAFCFL